MTTQNTIAISSASALAAMAAASMNSAFAADLPARTAAVAPLPVLATGWQGFYVGGSAGGTWLNSQMDDSLANPWGWNYGSPIGGDSHASKFGALAGVQAGFNMQSRNLVYGVEADFSFLNGKATSNGVMHTTGYGYKAATTKESQISNLGTLRARLGVDMNGTMPYLTAGVAFGRVSDRYATTNLSGYGANTDSTSRKWQTGFVVGGGIEHKITDHVSIKGEALFVGFADTSRTVPSDAVKNNGGRVKTSDNLTIGRIGLNYAF